MEFQEFSKNYWNILMKLLFQHPLYHQQQGFSIIFILILNDLDSVMLPFGSSL